MGTTCAMSARSLQYYVIAGRWLSDLEFFEIETAFLHRLMDDYFIRLNDPAFIGKFKKTGSDLLKLEEDKSRAHKMLNEQLEHLQLMAEDVIPESIDALTGKQIEIEYLMTNLTREYREVKKELFELVKSVMIINW
ncbi:MAG: hypothetical protein ACXVA2_04105 [Mucilaginibacter sp.]